MDEIPARLRTLRLAIVRCWRCAGTHELPRDMFGCFCLRQSFDHIRDSNRKIDQTIFQIELSFLCHRTIPRNPFLLACFLNVEYRTRNVEGRREESRSVRFTSSFEIPCSTFEILFLTILSALCRLNAFHENRNQFIAFSNDLCHSLWWADSLSFDDLQPDQGFPKFLQGDLHLVSVLLLPSTFLVRHSIFSFFLLNTQTRTRCY